jgi:hypothetical protein
METFSPCGMAKREPQEINSVVTFAEPLPPEAFLPQKL